MTHLLNAGFIFNTFFFLGGGGGLEKSPAKYEQALEVDFFRVNSAVKRKG